MSTKMLYKYTPALVREWPVPANTQPDTPVLSASNEPGVTITARGDATHNVTFVGIGTIAQPNGGVGNKSDSATVATDGTWVLPVTGAGAGTPKNALVYAVVASGAVTSLTLTAGSNVKFGVVDSYPGKATPSRTAVKIGVFA